MQTVIFGTRKGRNVSIDPEHEQAILWLAKQEGHENFSRIVQRLIEREMLGRFGPDWREWLRERLGMAS